MRTTDHATRLRARRALAGLSQRELAARSGVAQPNIAAYESGRRGPSAATWMRLDAALQIPTLARVRDRRDALVAAAERRGLTRLRVFGSVAHDAAEQGSDVDLLVTPGPTSSVFDLAGFMAEAAELLGIEVDVVSDRGSGPIMDRIRDEAIPL